MSEILIDGNCPLCGLRNHAPATCEQSRAEESAQIKNLLAPLRDQRTAKVINDLISERHELRAENTALLNLLREARNWMNNRVGECWKCHDAVNPGLFDAIDAAIRVPAQGTGQ